MQMNKRDNDIYKKQKLETFKINQNYRFPSNISFRQENYIKEIKNSDNLLDKFDVIFCLNTSKWIHINFGDNSIKLLFLNIYNQLRENGIFIFQFQNWKSYKKKKNFSKYISKIISGVKLKPDKFEDYLQTTFNFKLIKKVTLPNNSKKIFDRPLYFFQKNPFLEYGI